MKRSIGLWLLAGLSALTWAEPSKALRIGIEGEYPPFSAVNEQGELFGFDVDIAQALCQQMQRECELVQTPWDALVPSLNSHKLDALVASMSATEERKKSVDFTEPYYHNAGRFVLAKNEAEALQNDNWRSLLKGKTIGVQRGTVHERYVSETAKDVFAKIVIYATQEEVNLDLLSQRIDLTLADHTALAGGLLKQQNDYVMAAPAIDDVQYYGTGVAIAVRKGDQALQEALNAAIQALREQGEYQKINQKYFDFDIY